MKKIIYILLILLLAYSCDNKIDANDINPNSGNITDTTAPVITLTGDATMDVLTSGAYTEPGATATDDVDGTIEVIITGTVNIAAADDYTIIYTATDNAGNVATETRIVTVIYVEPAYLTNPITNPTSSLGSVQLSVNLPATGFNRGFYAWVEDADGVYVDTIEQYLGVDKVVGDNIHFYSGRFSNEGGRWRNDLCIAWNEAVGEPINSILAQDLVLDGIPYIDSNNNGRIDSSPDEVIDGYTSATLAGYTHTYDSVVWDCKDVNGDPVPSGLYTIQVEITYDTGSGWPEGDSYNGIIGKRATGEVIIWSENDSADLTVIDSSDINSATVEFTAN